MAGIYIHIPFCKHRCIYCDFYTTTNLIDRQNYMDALCREAELRKDYIEGEVVNTIYFGGGTPSLLQSADFEQIFHSLYKNFNVSADAEITLEANPDDLSSDYIKLLQDLPVNRLSMGVQSFNDKELKFLNRRHDAKQAIDVVQECRKAGFNNISIDLMYGLPEQTMDIWKYNLHQAVELDVQHISAYHLIYEEKTKLYRLLEKGRVKTIEENLSVDMFSEMIDQFRQACFEHYEISNFAKEGFISKHNSSYWLGTKYLGLGSSAHSYDGENRSWNISSVKEYIKGINNLKPNITTEYLDENMRYNDFILTGLRTKWGVDLKQLEQKFGDRKLNYCLQNIQKHIDRDKVIKVEDKLKLTQDGIFISDDIMSDLMYID